MADTIVKQLLRPLRTIVGTKRRFLNHLQPGHKLAGMEGKFLVTPQAPQQTLVEASAMPLLKFRSVDVRNRFQLAQYRTYDEPQKALKRACGRAVHDEFRISGGGSNGRTNLWVLDANANFRHQRPSVVIIWCLYIALTPPFHFVVFALFGFSVCLCVFRVFRRWLFLGRRLCVRLSFAFPIPAQNPRKHMLMTPSAHKRREIAAVIGLVAAMAVCLIGCHCVATVDRD